MEGSGEVQRTSNRLFEVNGEPLLFYVGLSTEKVRVEQLIEKHGGSVLRKLPENFRSQEITLNEDGLPCNPGQLIVLMNSCPKLAAGKSSVAKRTHCFSLAYVDACVEQNKLLNLNNFRICNKSGLADSSDNYQSKKRFLVLEEQLKTSPEDEELCAVPKHGGVATPDSVKRSRQKYTHEHDLILLKFVKEMMVKYPQEKPLGQKLWQRAEELRILGPHRSWQSMRERFKTRLQPYLHQTMSPGELWDQLPTDNENSVSIFSDEEDNKVTTSFSKATVQAIKDAPECDTACRSEVCETQTSSACPQERVNTLRESAVSSGEGSEHTILKSPNRFSVGNVRKVQCNSRRELRYDDDLNEMKQSQLVRCVIRELSTKYFVPEKQVCMALLDANGSVDLAVKFLSKQTV